jgi:outer membrane protein
MKHVIVLFIFLNIAGFVFGQESNPIIYSLQDCIEIALQNNLDLKSAALRTETENVNFKQSKNALLPSLNGSYNIGKTSGRSIDPFTNSYSNDRITFSTAGLQANAVIFDGFRLINLWKQQKLNLLASEMEKEEARQNLILEVTLTYLQVMGNRDLVNLAENSLENTKGQLERLKTLFEQEIGNPSEYRDFQGLKANDEAGIIEAKSNYDNSKLYLMQLMNTEMEFDLAPTDLAVEFIAYENSFEEVYASAIQNLAIVKANEFRLNAAEKGIAVAKSQYVPQVSFFANLGTNYSSVAQVFTEGQTSIIETGDFISFEGQSYSVLRENTDFVSEDISYENQFKNNFNSAVGIAVSIPIFNGFRAKNNVAIEKIKKDEASIELARTKRELRTIIEQSYNDMLAAYNLFRILQDQVTAYAESLRINEIRFNNGLGTSVEYIVSKNNLDNAKINLNKVTYEYLLRQKILDYYKDL